MNNLKKSLVGLIAAVLLVVGWATGILPGEQIQGTDYAVTTAIHETVSAPITEPQAIADYIFQHGCLPDNFITKAEAERLGWDKETNYVGDVAPGKSIGGDRFGNYEGLLPKASGRTYYEADCYYDGTERGACRIVFSNDGLVYYTADHYESFVEMKPSK